MKFYHNPTVEIMILQQNDIVRTSGGEDEGSIFLTFGSGRLGQIQQQIESP